MDFVTPYNEFYESLKRNARKCYKCVEMTVLHCYYCGAAICKEHIFGKRYTCEDCDAQFTS
jgi:hypothetical protein